MKYSIASTYCHKGHNSEKGNFSTTRIYPLILGMAKHLIFEPKLKAISISFIFFFYRESSRNCWAALDGGGHGSKNWKVAKSSTRQNRH
jgi:hypothetical protein